VTGAADPFIRPAGSAAAPAAAPMSATVQVAAALAEVGPEWDPLLASAGFQSSRAWFEALVAAALPPGTQPQFWMIGAGGRPLLLLPMLAGPGRRLCSLTTAYTTLFQPLAAPGATDAELHAAGAAAGRLCRAWPHATLEALDPDWPGLPPFLAGLRAAGLGVRRYLHFGNWHEPVATWDAYLASRPGPLRETIRRKSRACARMPEVRIEVVSGGDALAPALEAYESVYARSWKQPEPAPGLAAALLPRAAAAGALRLGVMWSGSQPVAAQYWTVRNGVAIVLKLAHDDAWRALSPGTVLTAHMIRSLIAEDGVQDLDFGRGDDAYKQSWASLRRQRIGVLIAPVWRPRGAAVLFRHDIGNLLRAVRRLATTAKL
jgi:CelD/BcsL family acetyltransferase involved in cellulose biosynthesis